MNKDILTFILENDVDIKHDDVDLKALDKAMYDLIGVISIEKAIEILKKMKAINSILIGEF